MSERGVRRFASGCVCRTEQVKQDYLFGDPDVVKVLRAIKKLQPDSSCPLTLSYLAEQIEQEFRVHLTETGWEWTEQVGV